MKMCRIGWDFRRRIRKHDDDRDPWRISNRKNTIMSYGKKKH